MSTTLVLDQGYRPHGIVSLKRAIGYILKGKVEVLEEYDADTGSAVFAIKLPAVVRFLYSFGGKIPPAKFCRMNLMARDDFTCQYCDKRFVLDNLTFDHVVPKGQGGTQCWENIVASCRPCNLAKGNRTPDEAMIRHSDGSVCEDVKGCTQREHGPLGLKRQPRRPHSAPEIMFRLQLGDSIPDAWASWCYWHSPLQEG